MPKRTWRIMFDSAVPFQEAWQTWLDRDGREAPEGWKPYAWARYLGAGATDIADPLTTAEIEALLSEGMYLLPVYNNCTGNIVSKGSAQGAEEAKKAIALADEIGVPDASYVALDLEHQWPLSAAFLEGWCDTMRQSRFAGSGMIYMQKEPWFDAPYTVAKPKNANVARALLWDAYWTAVRWKPQDGVPALVRLRAAIDRVAAWQFAGLGYIDVSAILAPVESVGNVQEGLWGQPGVGK